MFEVQAATYKCPDSCYKCSLTPIWEGKLKCKELKFIYTWESLELWQQSGTKEAYSTGVATSSGASAGHLCFWYVIILKPNMFFTSMVDTCAVFLVALLVVKATLETYQIPSPPCWRSITHLLKKEILFSHIIKPGLCQGTHFAVIMTAIRCTMSLVGS
jgi:hypothetical protein